MPDFAIVSWYDTQVGKTMLRKALVRVDFTEMNVLVILNRYTAGTLIVMLSLSSLAYVYQTEGL